MGLDDKSVAIIGAGPAGGIALESFLRQGFKRVTVFERRPVVGGTWTLDETIGARSESGLPLPEPAQVRVPPNVASGTRERPIVADGPAGARTRPYDGTLYPQVETNVTADLMAFTSKPFPDIKPHDTFDRFGVEDAFRSHEVVRQYVLEYFEGRDEYVLLSTAVEKAFKTSAQAPWTLVLHRGNEWWTEEFDFLYVSAGRFDKPRIPEIAGLDAAVRALPQRTIIHTKAFRGPAEFEGKRKVLLIGASFSNSDVAHLIKNTVELPIHLSLRGIEEYNLLHFLQPWIAAHPGVERFDVSAADPHLLDVTFTDGSVLEGVDKVVFGTGYVFSFPFLDEYTVSRGYPIVSADGTQTRNLYWFTWWAADPTLAVSSAINEGITWRVMEAQAKASSFLWSGNGRPLPSTDEAVAWEVARRKQTGDKYFQRWHPDYAVLFEGLANTSTGAPQFPGENVDYEAYAGAVENSLNLKGVWYRRLAATSIAEHPEWKEQYEKTTVFLKERERPFNAEPETA